MLIIQVVLGVIASTRGWGILPFYLLGAGFALGFIIPPVLGIEELSRLVLVILSIALTGMLTGMAIAGRAQPEQAHTETPTHTREPENP